MKQLIAIVFFAVSFLPAVKAQVVGGKFDKLLDLYAMERYEDCAYKAEKLTQSDKYRREAEPYLYMSMCMYQIHMSKEEYDPEIYKDPLKDAMKYAYKFRKKDKDQSYYEGNLEFLNDLKKEGLEQARFFFKDSDYRKAASVYGRVSKFAPEDNSVLYVSGVCNILAKNAGPGALQINQAVKAFSDGMAENDPDVDPISKDHLIAAFVKYTDYLNESQLLDSARITIDFANKLIAEDIDLVNQRKKLNK